jgi:CTP:molybdopterin cytidylyltransferase MocA
MNYLIESFSLILLAGGKSSRMGVAKGLLPYNGRSWLLEQLDRFAAAGGRQAVVVLGYRSDEYCHAISWLQDACEHPVEYHGLKVSACVNPTPELGPFSSIQAGTRTVAERMTVDGAYILPIDVPCPRETVWAALAEAHTEQTAVCMPRFGGRGGHPVLLSAAFLTQIMAESPESEDARLDRQIRKLEAELIEQVVVDDDSISLNLNTPERWQEYVNARSLSDFT